VQLNGLTFDEDRLKCLDTETVQRRCTVQQNRVLANYFVQNIPNDSFFTLHHFFGGFNGCSQTAQLQLAENERLEQFQCHLLRQSTRLNSSHVKISYAVFCLK